MYFVKRAINTNTPIDRELVGQFGTQAEAAECVYRTWPSAICAPYTTKQKSGPKFFKRSREMVVLLVWETFEAMQRRDPPVGFVEEVLTGFAMPTWSRNVPATVGGGV